MAISSPSRFFQERLSLDKKVMSLFETLLNPFFVAIQEIFHNPCTFILARGARLCRGGTPQKWEGQAGEKALGRNPLTVDLSRFKV
jgi:hypothetical protein